MKYVADDNNLEYNKDTKLLTIGTADLFSQHLINNKNKTKYGVIFCVQKMDYYNVSIPCDFEFENKTMHMYTLVYNITNAPNGFLTTFHEPLPIDRDLLKLKISIDNAYLAFHSRIAGEPESKINIETQPYPSSSNRFTEGANIIGVYGALYFFFPPVISFVIILLEITREKDLKLRKVNNHLLILNT